MKINNQKEVIQNCLKLNDSLCEIIKNHLESYLKLKTGFHFIHKNAINMTEEENEEYENSCIKKIIYLLDDFINRKNYNYEAEQIAIKNGQKALKLLGNILPYLSLV